MKTASAFDTPGWYFCIFLFLPHWWFALTNAIFLSLFFKSFLDENDINVWSICKSMAPQGSLWANCPSIKEGLHWFALNLNSLTVSRCSHADLKSFSNHWKSYVWTALWVPPNNLTITVYALVTVIAAQKGTIFDYVPDICLFSP